MSRRWKIFSIVLVVNLVADQLTKWWAKATLPVDSRGWGIPQVFIENFWDWQLSYNQGSAFGLFHGIGGARIFLTIIGIGALVAVGFMVKNAGEKQTRLVVGLGMVAGGAIGNIVDRVIHGSVTDFVVWKYYESTWPTFNVADVSLVIGVGLMLLDMGKAPKEADGPEDSEKSSSRADAQKLRTSKKSKKSKRSKKSKKSR